MANSRGEFSNKLRHSIDRGDGILFGKILQTEVYPDESFKVSISLLNMFMFLADLSFLRNNYEYVVDIQSDNEIFENIDNNITQYREQDFEGYHPFFYEFEAISSDNHIRDFIRSIIGEWVPLRITSESNEELSLRGTITFSASPLELNGMTLVFDNSLTRYNNICKKIKATYSLQTVKKLITKHSDYTALTKFFGLLPSQVDYIEGKVFSVGNANNIELHVSGKQGKSTTILYDVGCSDIKEVQDRAIVAYNLNSFATKTFDSVVLSHWDTDHILAVGYYNENVLYSKNMVWIVPDLGLLTEEEVSLSAIRLAFYMAKKSLVYFSNNLNSKLGPKSKDGYFELWQGKGTTKKAATHQNNIGLIVRLRLNGISIVNQMIGFGVPGHREVNALLCGDCVYDNIPDKLKESEYDILVVPHHGSKFAIPDLSGNNSSAIICADDSRHKESFPGSDHVLKLIESGFNHIYVTKEVGNIDFFIVT